MYKEWVIIFGTLLILIILIDGIRRKRNERFGKIKVSRSLKKRPKASTEADDLESEPAPSYISELPNGGARVIGSRDNQGPLPSIEKKATAKSYLEKQSRQELLQTEISRRARRSPEQASLNLDESVPILMESVADAKSRVNEQDKESSAAASHTSERIEPSFSALSPSALDEDYDAQNEIDEPTAADDELDEYQEDQLQEEAYDEFDDAEPDAEDYEEDELDEDYADESESAAEAPNTEPEEVLIINVMAFKGEMFNGADLLDIVLKCGMRFGDMDIFHRYSDAKGEGALIFSMANMVKPGTFDLDTMDEFETPGISLFMTLPLKADSMQSFDLMLDTARAIAETLDGELKDEQRSVMTRQTVEHCRQRVRDFERRRLFRRPT